MSITPISEPGADPRIRRKHQWAKCEECPIREDSGFVPTENPQPSGKIIIMGEAPGAHEERKGIPFTGPSGELLNQILQHHNIRRPEVMITNACLCVKGDTKVRLANGLLRSISDLVARQARVEVLSYRDGKMVPARVTGWYRNHINGRKLLRISHKYAKGNARGKVGFTVTEDHPVLTNQGWLRADELVIGETIIATGLAGLGPKQRQLILSGILGDAALQRRSGMMFMNSAKQSDYLEAKARIFGGNTFVLSRQDTNMRYFSTPSSREVTSLSDLSKVEVVRNLDLFGFACWFFDDGYTRFRDDRQPSAEIAITSWSMPDALRVAKIITEKFVECSVYESSAGPRLNFNVENTAKLLPIIAPFATPSVQYKTGLPGCIDWGTEDAGVFFDVVSDVTEVTQRGTVVYCLEVEDTHNFAVVGGVVHNCRPKDNADPPKAALAACSPRLQKEIEYSGADTIVAVGKVAAFELLEDRGSMRKMRVGPPKPYKHNPNINVVATWHPAYSLRSPDSFPDLVFDFGKIRGGQQHDWVEPDYRVFDDPVSTVRALQELRARFDRIVIDIETGVEKDNSFDHPSEYDLLCVGIAFAKGKAVVVGENALRHDDVRLELRRLLSTTKLIAHNGKFDLAGLRNVCGRQTLWFDTMLASNCLDERPGHHGLKQLSIERLGAPDYEADIRDYVPRGGNYANIPREVLYRYNAYDVVCTWDLYELFSGEMSDADWQKHEFIVQAANALIELELNGIHFDVAYNEKLSHEYVTKLNALEEKMNELVGYPVNPRSPKQLLEYYATQGLQLPKTDADLLKELIELISGEVRIYTKMLLEHRRQSKLYGTYVKGLAKRVTSEGKVYTTYTLHGTTSGRLASRQPNLQNVVREKSIRNQFVVGHEENLFIQLDYKQAEGRVITTLAQDEYLREIFADSSRDLFSELCNDIFGVGNWEKENRVSMKSIFYGNAYGRGAKSIAKELQLQGVNITEGEATKLMREFNQLIPDVMKWQAAVKHQVMSGEDLTTPFGRKRSFWLITDKNKTDVLNEALSYMPQSIASDICLRALIRLTPMLRGLATPRLTIHDAIVVETHKDKVEEVIELMRREMVQSATEFTTYVPFEVDASVGTRWGDL